MTLAEFVGRSLYSLFLHLILFWVHITSLHILIRAANKQNKNLSVSFTSLVDWYKSVDLNQWCKSRFKSSNNNHDLNQAIKIKKIQVVLNLYVMLVTQLFSILIGFHIAYAVLI